MLDKKTFIKLMTELVRLKKLEDDLHKVFKKLSPEFNWWGLDAYETIVVDALEECMDDKYEHIKFWIYDLQCGFKAKENTITDEDGEFIPIKTLSNLYDLITKK